MRLEPGDSRRRRNQLAVDVKIQSLATVAKTIRESRAAGASQTIVTSWP